MKHIRLYIATLVLLLGFGGSVFVPAVAMASPKSEVCSTIGGGSDCGSQPANGVSLNSVITAVINILSVVIGIVAVVMIMIGGFKYITSNGDSNAISSAKSTVTYAIIGLIIVALAQIIVQFVLAKTTGQK